MTEGQNNSILQVRCKMLMGTQMFSPKTPKVKYDMVGTISYKLVILVQLDRLERKRATVNVS